MEEPDEISLQDMAEAMGAMGGMTQCSIREIIGENDALLSSLKKLDPVAGAVTFGGLLTSPQLQANCLRLEALVHLALALGSGTKRPNEQVVAKAFRALNDVPCGWLEDPAEDMFVTAVRTPKGNFRLLEGVWEGNAFYLQRFVDAIEDMPPGTGYDEIRESVYALLQLSDVVCQRAGLTRFELGEELPIKFIPRRNLKELLSRRNHLRFPLSELPKSGIDPLALAPFLFTPAGRQDLLEQTPGNTELERAPLIRDSENLYLVLPTAVSAAVRYFVIQRMREGNMLSAFSKGLAAAYAKMLNGMPLLGGPIGAPIRFGFMQDGGIAEVVHTIDEGRYVHFIFHSDGLADFDETGLAGLNPGSELITSEIEKRIFGCKAQFEKGEGFRGGLSLVVGCGAGRASEFFLPAGLGQSWRVEGLSAYDLETLSWLSDFRPETLWRMLVARDQVRTGGLQLINPNGLLNLVAWARELNGHLVPHADMPDEFGGAGGMVLINQNGQRKLRHACALENDPHVERDVSGSWRRIRKDRQSVFEDDLAAPLYASEQPGITGKPASVFKTGRRTWWAELFVPEKMSGLPAYERWRMLGVWLSRAASVLDELGGLPEGPIYWKAVFEGISGEFEIEAEKSNFVRASAAISIKTDRARSIIETVASTEYEAAVFHPENIAERALVLSLIRGAAELAGTTLSEEEREALLGRIVQGPFARHGHAFMVREFRDHVRDQMRDRVIKITKEDDAFTRLDLGWKVRDRSLPPLIRGKEDCTRYLNDVVTQQSDELCQKLRQFNRARTIELLLQNYEAAVSDRDRWRRTTASLLALHPDRQSALRTIADQEFRLNAVFQSSRILVEMAVCECPEEGGLTPGAIDLSHLMTLAGLLFEVGGWSDAIRWDVMEPELRITPLGDIHAKFDFVDDIIMPHARITSERRANLDAEKYADQLQDYAATPKTEHLLDPEFVEAWKEQFGAGFDESRAFIDAIEDIGLKADRPVHRTSRSELEQIGSGEWPVTPEATANLIEALSLKPRSSWRETPEGFQDRDRHPWRFRRRLSLLRRPLVQLDDGDDPTLIFAPGQVRDSFTYMLGNLLRGEFPQNQLSPKMKRWAGKAADQKGKEFTQKVADQLRDLGWSTETEVTIAKLLGQRQSKDFGDVDVLAWSAESGRVLIIECKDVHYRKTFGEVAEQLADFRGGLRENGKADYLRKHLDRVEIIRKNMEAVKSFIGIDDVCDVESHLVFANPVPMEFALARMSEMVRVSNVDQLVRSSRVWLAHTILPS